MDACIGRYQWRRSSNLLNRVGVITTLTELQGRDDWLWVSETGATTTFTNSRSCQPGVEGNGMNIYWRQGFWNGATSGPTHSGPGSDGRNRIHFARIYGESAFGMLPKADYIHMTSVSCASESDSDLLTSFRRSNPTAGSNLRRTFGRIQGRAQRSSRVCWGDCLARDGTILTLYFS